MKNSQHADLKPSLIDLEVDNNTTGGKQENISVQPERLSERDNMYCVYWIHLENDNTRENGYVGITNNFNNRLRQHFSQRKNTHFKNAINKYGWSNLIKEIIHDNLSLEEALEKEEFYRPTQNIGWNMQKGGELGVEKEWYLIKENSEKHSYNTSIATKIAIKEKDSFEKRSKRAKDNWIKNRDSYIDHVKGSRNPRAILNEDQVKCIKCELLKKGLKHTEIAKMYDIGPHIVDQIKSNKNWKHVVCDSPAHSG